MPFRFALALAAFLTASTASAQTASLTAPPLPDKAPTFVAATHLGGGSNGLYAGVDGTLALGPHSLALRAQFHGMVSSLAEHWDAVNGDGDLVLPYATYDVGSLLIGAGWASTNAQARVYTGLGRAHMRLRTDLDLLDGCEFDCSALRARVEDRVRESTKFVVPVRGELTWTPSLGSLGRVLSWSVFAQADAFAPERAVSRGLTFGIVIP
jgi:hypothetical protein